MIHTHLKTGCSDRALRGIARKETNILNSDFSVNYLYQISIKIYSKKEV
jgi:hypothetical protein